MINDMEGELMRAEVARKSSVDDAIEAEGAMQSRYSTFKEEAQYLAAGYSKRAVELHRDISVLREFLYRDHETAKYCVVGSLISVRSVDGLDSRHYLLLKAGGGRKIFYPPKNIEVAVVNVKSPIGRGLLKKEMGDAILP